MRRINSASVLFIAALAFLLTRPSPALGPQPVNLSAKFPHEITVTADTLVESRPGTDSLVLELPYRLWTRTPVQIHSPILDVEWIEIDTGNGWFCRVIEVDTGFRKESLKQRVEYTITFLDADGHALSRGRHIADPKDYVPVELRHIVTTHPPVLFATAPVPGEHSRTLSAKLRGSTCTARVPTNWETCRIEIRPGPPGRRPPEYLDDERTWPGDSDN